MSRYQVNQLFIYLVTILTTTILLVFVIANYRESGGINLNSLLERNFFSMTSKDRVEIKKNKVFIIHISTDDCIHCKEDFITLEKIWMEFGIRSYGIIYSKKSFNDFMSIKLPYSGISIISDKEKNILKIKSFPSTVIFDKNHKHFHHLEGKLQYNEFVRLLRF